MDSVSKFHETRKDNFKKKDTIWYKDVIDLGFTEEESYDVVYETHYGYKYVIIELEFDNGICFIYEKENPNQVRLLRVDSEETIISEMLITKFSELERWINFFKNKTND